MKNTTLTITAPDGYEIMSDMPTSIMNDDSCLFVRYDIKPIAHPQVDKHAELKAQYARDVEMCKGIDGLEAFMLYQFSDPFDKNDWLPLSNDKKKINDIFDTFWKYRRHPHADLMIEYHKGSDADKARWQFKYKGHDEWTFFTTIRTDNKWTEWDELTDYRLKPIVYQQVDKHAELKEQYQRDVETCKGIDGLEAWNLWQCITLKGGFTQCDIPPKWLDQSEYRRHPHADSMIQYHQGSERDKQRWEYSRKNYFDPFESCGLSEPFWLDDCEYRLKPETIAINGKEYNAPLRVAPEIGTIYWYFLNDYYKARQSVWDEMGGDFERLNNNNCFASKEDCQVVADAFNAILRGDL